MDRTLSAIELREEGGEVSHVTGVRLAYRSTASAGGRGSRRWTEMAIYRLAGGEVAVQEIGRSTQPGEVDRFRVVRAPTAREAFDAIASRRRITTTDSDLFAAAAAADLDFARSIGDAYAVEDLHDGISALMQDDRVHEVVLERDGDRALRFRGIELAHTSSYVDGATSWQEIRIFRAIDGRIVAQKALCGAGESEPIKSAVSIVQDAPAVLRALVRPGSAWVESTILGALKEAALLDAAFSKSLGDLLHADNFRAYVAENREISAAERRTLTEMASGASIVADTASDLGRPVLLRWEGASPAAQLPHPKVFVALSRDRLIRKGPEAMSGGTHFPWTITDRGRRALSASESNS